MEVTPSVVHVITDLKDGGAEAALYRLCSVEGRAWVPHVISLMGPGKYGPKLEAAGVPVISMNMPQGRVSLSGLWLLWRTLRKIQPQAVQTWMYHADFLGGVTARLAGIRNVHWGVHNSVLVPGQNSRSTILIAHLCAWLSHFVPRTVICCAQKAADVHRALGYRASALRTIPNGYDLEQFRPSREQRSAVRHELGFADEAIIGFVARYDPAKDHANLLSALAVLRQKSVAVFCLLVGSGMDDSNIKLKEHIARHGLEDQVILLGRRDDIPSIMNAIDVHVLSSSAEAFPNVLAEAMACGTPCVSTDVGDAVDIVGESGWIVRPGDPQALAEKIGEALEAISHPDWESRKSQARNWIASSFSIARMERNYRQAWGGQPSGSLSAN